MADTVRIDIEAELDEDAVRALGVLGRMRRRDGVLGRMAAALGERGEDGGR